LKIESNLFKVFRPKCSFVKSVPEVAPPAEDQLQELLRAQGDDPRQGQRVEYPGVSFVNQFRPEFARQILRSQSGLPGGLFSNQKSQFG
jgi:hypothetical protein